VSKVANMSYMFYGAHDFNQDISPWKVGQVTKRENVFGGRPIDFAEEYKPKWNAVGGGAKKTTRASKKRSRKGRRNARITRRV